MSRFAVVVLSLCLFAGAVNAQAGCVSSGSICDGAITTAKIADLSMKEKGFADGAITKAKLATGSITNDKLADLVIDSRIFKAGVVSAIHIKSGEIKNADIADNTITGVKFAANAVTTNKIALDSLTKDNLGKESVTGANMRNGIIYADTFGTITEKSYDNKADMEPCDPKFINCKSVACEEGEFGLNGGCSCNGIGEAQEFQAMAFNGTHFRYECRCSETDPEFISIRCLEKASLEEPLVPETIVENPEA